MENITKDLPTPKDDDVGIDPQQTFEPEIVDKSPMDLNRSPEDSIKKRDKAIDTTKEESKSNRPTKYSPYKESDVQFNNDVLDGPYLDDTVGQNSNDVIDEPKQDDTDVQNNNAADGQW